MVKYLTLEDALKAYQTISDSVEFWGSKLEELQKISSNDLTEDEQQKISKKFLYYIGRLRYEDAQLNALAEICKKNSKLAPLLKKIQKLD